VWNSKFQYTLYELYMCMWWCECVSSMLYVVFYKITRRNIRAKTNNPGANISLCYGMLGYRMQIIQGIGPCVQGTWQREEYSRQSDGK
jgi:hypothetical protein